MGPKSERRATTLSISVTPELASEVSSRVESGMYSSASEFVREAIRLLLRAERSRAEASRADAVAEARAQFRFESASRLQDQGLELQAVKLRAAHPGLTPAQIRERLDELANAQETGPGLRLAPERLERLKLDEPD